MLIHCNTLFERRIGGNTRQTNNDGQCMAKNNNTTLSQSTVTNNDKQRDLTNPFHSSKYSVITISNMFIMSLAKNDGPSISLHQQHWHNHYSMTPVIYSLFSIP
jgi:hypothetical protein